MLLCSLSQLLTTVLLFELHRLPVNYRIIAYSDRLQLNYR